MHAEAKLAMTPGLSARALGMPKSSIRRIFNAAKAVEAGGERVIPLHIGDPDFELPERITDGISAALKAGHTHYSPMPGIPPLRDALAKHVAGRMGLPYGEADFCNLKATPDEQALSALHVVLGAGATYSLNTVLNLIMDPGSTLLLPQVYFPNYMQQCCLARVKTRHYPFGDDFQPQLDGLDALIDDSTRAIMINSPSNPTGAVFSPATIRALYEFAERHGLWIISDEAYIDYVYKGDYLSPLSVDWERPAETRRVFAVLSFSKSYAATGLRIGWTVCPNTAIATQLALLNEPYSGSLSTPLQHGLLKAFAEDDTSAKRAELARRRLVAAELLNESGFSVEPVDGGMFYFIDISGTGMDGDEFADKLLAEERVAVVPGSGFGLEAVPSKDCELSYLPNQLAARCVRICFGVAEDVLHEGVTRLARFIETYTK